MDRGAERYQQQLTAADTRPRRSRDRLTPDEDAQRRPGRLLRSRHVAGSPITLMYHDVVPRQERDQAGFAGPVAGVYKLDPEAFTAHLGALAATGRRIGVYRERPDAVLTFDDGGASAGWIATELERHGMRGAFFVVTGRIGTPGFLDADGVKELAARGHDVGSHSHTHPPYMGRLGRAELAAEWTRSRELLGELLGSAPISAAVPGGSVSRDLIEEVAAAGYEWVFTSTPSARVSRQSGLEVIGRYTIWAGDSAKLAAAFVRRAPVPRARRWLAWELKSAAKRVSPRAYEAARAARAGRPSSTRNDASRAV
jgi:peptidoglycan/xylan/chitin deacetylase (PgdA/CDA1 family)